MILSKDLVFIEIARPSSNLASACTKFYSILYLTIKYLNLLTGLDQAEIFSLELVE